MVQLGLVLVVVLELVASHLDEDLLSSYDLLFTENWRDDIPHEILVRRVKTQVDISQIWIQKDIHSIFGLTDEILSLLLRHRLTEVRH